MRVFSKERFIKHEGQMEYERSVDAQNNFVNWVDLCDGGEVKQLDDGVGVVWVGDRGYYCFPEWEEERAEA